VDPVNQSDLHALKDIQIPDAVPWWPPAPLWWLLLALLVLLLSLLLYRLHLRRTLRRAALRELAKIQANSMAGCSPQRLAMDLSMLLRRVALAGSKKQQIAGLTGGAWLEFLDSRFSAGSPFSNGAGSILIRAPYAADTEFERQKLISLCGDWIRENT